MKTKATWLAMSVVAVLIAAGCGGTKTVGTPAGADVSATPLAAVLEAPEKYDGQTVVLKGVLEAQCAAQCDFTYSEGGRSVTVYTPDPKPPKIKGGQPVRVTATVHRGEKQVILTAKGLELLPRKGA
jgi:multidrug efflux pump subunit AcrA (membrane-fusion protein)